MERSRDLRGLVITMYQELAACDPALVEIFASDEEVIAIGTDPAEWWCGGALVKAVYKQQLSEVGGFEILPGDLHAFVNGEVGWVVDNPTFIVRGVELHPRTTLIFERRGPHWRCVHWHLSLGQLNEESFGMELTTTIDAIAGWAEEAKPDLSSSVSAQGTVTIAFTDMESSTATNEALGDDRFVPLLLKHNEIVAAKTKDADGMVVKSQGDGFMLAFPSARRAVSCLIDVQREVANLDAQIKVRMGLHTGEPTRHADDFFGRDVAYAARIGAAASGGEILVSDLVKSLVEPGGTITFDGPRTLDLKGFEGPQPVYAVRWS
jgi:class 3 adenylate cyclase